MPKISYLVSTYNSADYLDRCIRDLMLQSEQNFEIIIVNPNSPDRDDEIAQEWLDRDSRIRYFYVKEREPYGQSWLRAWQQAESPIVCNANTDDTRHYMFGTYVISALESTDGIAFVYPGVNVVNQKGIYTGGGERGPFDRNVFKKECHGGPCVAWRTSLRDEVNMDEAWERAGVYTSAFDYWLWLKFMSLGYDGKVLYGVPVTYTQRPDSIENSSGPKSTWQSFCAISEFFPEAIQEIGKEALDFLSFPVVPPQDEWCEMMKTKIGPDDIKRWDGAKINIFAERV